MKKALITIIIAAFCFLIIMYCIQYIVDNGLKKAKEQYFTVWNDLYSSKINADVLILGGSRARLIISPKVLDSVLHTNSYNLGIDGGYFPIQNAMFKVYLEHNKKPKYIIQVADFFTFTNGTHLSNSEQFIPYIDDTIVRSMTSHYEEKFTKPELYFPLFKYNNHLNLIKEGIFCYFNLGHTATNKLYKGFGARGLGFDSFFAKRMKNESDFLRNNIQKDVDAEFLSYLEFCKNNNIKLIFVYVPVLSDASVLMKKDTSEITRK